MNAAQPSDECTDKIIKKVERAVTKLSERSGCVFNLEDAAQSLYQVKSDVDFDNVGTRNSSLLGKRAHSYAQPHSCIHNETGAIEYKE